MKSVTRFTMVSGVTLLLAGLMAMIILFQFREPPAEASVDPKARAVHVETIPAEPIAHRVTVSGFATARPARLVALSMQVSGVVTWTHPSLHEGGRVSEGETLLRIDPTPYETNLAEARAQASEIEASIEELRIQHEVDVSRIQNRERGLALSEQQLQRATTLFTDYVGNKVDMERAEQALISVREELNDLRAEVAAYPTRVEQMHSRLRATQAVTERAELALRQTELRAPFPGRIDEILAGPRLDDREATLTRGFYATDSVPLLTLADDQKIELPTKLDAAEARRWLPAEVFAGTTTSHGAPSAIRWTESIGDELWHGQVDRVSEYDSESRTITLVVSVSFDPSDVGVPPLSPGMFCEVTIPGKTLHGVYRVPRSALSVDDEVYVARNDRLERRPVEVIATEGDAVFVSSGLEPGDAIIVTRLINPISGTLLDVANQHADV